MDDLYRLVYTSKNLLPGPEQTMAAAIVEILGTSQRNNSSVDVTGALMFNGRAFAQVLEGPRRAVEATFERIQCDDRHGDVTVLQCAPVDVRGFANWSMAFVGQSSRGQSLWQELAAESGFDAARLKGDSVFEMLHGLLVEEEGSGSVGRTSGAIPTAVPSSRKAPADPLFDQIREELAEIGPRAIKDDILSGYRAAAPSRDETERKPQAAENASAGPLEVIRQALRAERRLTTELKDQIDDLRLSLAATSDDLRVLQAERDKWMARAGALALIIAQEAQATPRLDQSGAVKVAACAPTKLDAA